MKPSARASNSSKIGIDYAGAAVPMPGLNPPVSDDVDKSKPGEPPGSIAPSNNSSSSSACSGPPKTTSQPKLSVSGSEGLVFNVESERPKLILAAAVAPTTAIKWVAQSLKEARDHLERNDSRIRTV